MVFHSSVHAPKASVHVQDRKPGRNLVAFLLIANMAIYFWETMEIKNVSEQTERKEFYGAILWTLFRYLGRGCL